MSKNLLGRKAPKLNLRLLTVFLSIMIVIAVLLQSGLSHSVLAAPLGKVSADPRIDKLKGDLEYVSKQEAEEINKYLALKAESQKAVSDLAAIDKKIKAAESRQASARADAEAARAEFAAAQLRYDQAVAESLAAHERSQQAVVRLYQESSDPQGVPSILSASPEERQGVIRRSTLMQKYNDDQSAVIRDADMKAQDANLEKLAHDDARVRAEEAEKVASEEEQSLVPLRSQLAQVSKKAKDSELAEQAIVKSLQSKKAAYTKQMAQLQAESDALAAQIRKQQSTTTPVVAGKMMKPVNAAINSSFGYRTHPIYGDQRLHAGIDFSASYSTAIKAAKAGKVIYASEMSGYGNVIILDHGGSISTLYAHQSSFAVGLGAIVTQGQVIGYVGSTGNVTGPHLHFEVRLNGAPVDPMGYF